MGQRDRAKMSWLGELTGSEGILALDLDSTFAYLYTFPIWRNLWTPESRSKNCGRPYAENEAGVWTELWQSVEAEMTRSSFI
jgi:hypothetical protein